MQLIKDIYHKTLDIYLKYKRHPYLNKLRQFITPETSIISSNCFAGRILQDFGWEYTTPTVGLYFWAADYIEFLKHLHYYLTEAKITFVDHSKYTLGDIKRARWKHWYPIGWLDDKVEIHFLHYHSEEEAINKWLRRAKRVNFDNLLVFGMEQNLCTEKEIYAFDSLQFKKKYIFTTKNINLESNIYMNEFEKKGEVGDPYKKGHIFYEKLINKLIICQ